MENKVLLMIDALKDGFNRFADFSGVSSRSQYWYFILGTTIATVIAITSKSNGAMKKIRRSFKISSLTLI